MSARIVRTLSDLAGRWGGHIRLECARCQRVRLFAVGEISILFRKRRWDDTWKVINLHFRCAVCLSRPAVPQWVEHASEEAPGEQFACLAPYGINPRAWALASANDRARLIKGRR